MTEIFNTSKSREQYESSAIFLNPPPGLIDTVNKNFPKIWDLYNEMRALDWSENEFDFSTCANDFETAPKDIVEMMIKTLAFQWEADSIASQAPTVIIAPFSPATEVWVAEQRITDNESTHSNTYSEIVRNSFADPKAVLEEILEVQESFRRLDLVNGTLGDIKKISQEVGYKGIDSFEREFLHEILIRFYFAMLILERIQFMASFAITFTIAKAGYFQEIGQAVKKIAQDEFEVHCEYRKEVLRELIKMGNGQQIFDRIKDELTALVEEAIESETVWTKDFLFKERSLVGTNADLVVQWVKFCAADVVRTFDLPIDMTDWPTANPMPHLEEWLNPNILQVAPQEQTVSAYKLNVVSKDIADDEFDF